MADDEIGSMQVLMASVLNAEIMSVFRLGRADIQPQLGLFADLHMNRAQQSTLTAFVAEYFDGVRLEIGAHTTLGDVYEQVTER